MSERKRLDKERKSITHSFKIMQHEGYVTAGMYEDGTLGEVFISGFGKEGSTLRGILEGWAIAVSMGLQYGIPLEDFTNKFSGMKFEPQGETDNPNIKTANSVLDYIVRWLTEKFDKGE